VTIPVLHIVGYSGSGKTTLIEKLLPLLKGQGLRVATLKHSHHVLEMDQRGKDSWRHKQAGADTSALVGAGQWMMVCELADDFTPQQWANQYAQGHNLVLVEGYHNMAGVKVEVVRQAHSRTLRCDASSLLAVMSDGELQLKDVVQIGLNDISALSDVVLQWLQEGKYDG